MASPEPKESSPPGEWTLVDRQGEEEGYDDGNTSSSSSEFVHVAKDTVSYHLHRQDSSTSDTDRSISDSGEDGSKTSDADLEMPVCDLDAPLDLRIPSNVQATAEQETATSPGASILESTDSCSTGTNSSDTETSSTGTEETSCASNSTDAPVKYSELQQSDDIDLHASNEPQTDAAHVATSGNDEEELVAGPVEGAVAGLVSYNTAAPPTFGRTSSQESSLRLQLVLRPRSLSTSDSDGENDDRENDDGENDDNDISTESGTEDDRIESDQSDGVPGPPDDDEDDLSFSHAGIENIPLHEPNRHRQYVHEPNKGLSGTLSLVVIMAGWLALGLGIGHSFGSSHERVQSDPADIAKLHSTQDELFICRQKNEALTYDFKSERALWKTMMAGRDTRIWEKDKQVEELKHKTAGLMEEKTKLLEIKADLEALVMQLHTAAITQPIPDNPSKTIGLQKETVIDPPNEGQQTDPDESLIGKEGEMKKAMADEDEDEGVSIEDINEEFESETENLQRDMSSRNSEKTEAAPEEDLEVEGNGIDGDIPEDQISSPAEEYENETEKLRRELQLANTRAEMWQSLYLSEQQQRHEDEGQVKNNFTPNVLSCLSLFRPRVNFSQIVRLVNHTIIEGMSKVQNLTNLTRYLEESWEHMKATSASEFHTVFEEFQTVFNKITELWVGSGNNNSGTAHEGMPRGQGDSNADGSGRESDNSDYHKGEGRGQYSWSSSVKDFLNKSQESVSKVSQEIQEKWERMKNLSENLWKKHKPTINKLHQDFSQGFAKISSKLTEKIQKKTKSWFRSKKVRKEQKKQQRRAKRYEGEEKIKKSEDSSRDKRHRKHGKIHHHHHPNGKDRGKCKEGHCEIKDQKEMKKVLKRLHHRIRRIHFKGFTRMSRGDIEDVYEDLLDFHDDFGTKFPQKGTKGWFNCQVLWWKVHFHGNTFLDQWCTPHLEEWQVKVGQAYAEQQSNIHHGKKNLKHHHGHHDRWEKDGKRSDHAKSEHGKDADHGRHQIDPEGAFGGTKRRGATREFNSGLHDTKAGKATPDKQQGDLKQNFSMSGEWFFKLHDRQNYLEEEPWYTRRMDGRKRHHQDRSADDHHSSKWVFERAKDRNFQRSRSASWYFQRAARKHRHSGYNGEHRWRHTSPDEPAGGKMNDGLRIFDCWV